VEVEVSRSALGKLPIFAAFKIPEVWRYDGERVTILRLGAGGMTDTSRSIQRCHRFC